MQVRMIIFPSEDGLNVVLWGRWVEGSVRTRYFDNRTSMIAVLESLRFLTPEQASVTRHYR